MTHEEIPAAALVAEVGGEVGGDDLGFGRVVAKDDGVGLGIVECGRKHDARSVRRRLHGGIDRIARASLLVSRVLVGCQQKEINFAGLIAGITGSSVFQAGVESTTELRNGDVRRDLKIKLGGLGQRKRLLQSEVIDLGSFVGYAIDVVALLNDGSRRLRASGEGSEGKQHGSACGFPHTDMVTRERARGQKIRRLLVTLVFGLAVLGGVVKPDLAASVLFGRIDDAGIKRARVDVKADGALAELAGIEHPVHGFERIDGAGLKRVDLDDIGGAEIAGSGLDVLTENFVVFHPKTADGRGHPAILVAMIVNAAQLANIPADCEHFE